MRRDAIVVQHTTASLTTIADRSDHGFGRYIPHRETGTRASCDCRASDSIKPRNRPPRWSGSQNRRGAAAIGWGNRNSPQWGNQGFQANSPLPNERGNFSTQNTPQGGRLKIPHSNNLSRGGEIRDPAAWLATAPTEEIAHRIPPERWLDLGWKLTRPEGFGALSCEFPHIADLDEWLAQAPLETIAASVPAERRDNLGWNLVRLAALPKPKKKKPGKSVPGVNWRRKTTDEQRRDVIRLRALGVQYKEITRLTKVNRGTAQSIVKLGR